MAYSYNDYVSGTNSDGTSYTVTTDTVFASPPYLSGRGDSDVTVTVDGVTKVKDTDYTITNTEVKFLFGKIPAAGAKIRISRNSSQAQRITDYSDASLLNADTMDTDANQLFFMAQEAIDTASETNLAVSTFYSSGTSTPSSASSGDLFFNTATGLLQIYTGSAWESVNNRGTKQTFAISGSTTVFTPSTPVDDNTLVFLNGVLLVKGAGSAGDYTTSSTQVTLNTAVTSGVVEIVTFPNATNGTFTSGINVTGTVTADALTMGDNEKITLGTGSDLEIYSDGTNGIIEEKSTSGNLVIKGKEVVIKDTADNRKIYAVDGSTGKVHLHYGDATTPKLTTESTGINVTGDVAATTVTVGDSTGTNLELYEDGSQNAIIKQRGTGGLQISGVNGSLANDDYEQLVTWDADNVNLSWQGTTGAGTKLSTTSAGIDVTGTITPSGGYKSSDGTAGFTGSASASATLTIKDGLIVAVS